MLRIANLSLAPALADAPPEDEAQPDEAHASVCSA